MKTNVIEIISEKGLVPIAENIGFGSDVSIEALEAVIDALMESKLPVLEIANRDPGTIALFEVIAEKVAGVNFFLGAGTVRDVISAGEYINRGAQFIVAPTFDPEVAALCNRRWVPYIPGCGSLNEVEAALTAGASAIKIFPSTERLVTSIRQIHPGVPLIAAGGVTKDDLEKWFLAPRHIDAVVLGGPHMNIGLREKDIAAFKKDTASVLERITKARK